jgi:hypothetical protein
LIHACMVAVFWVLDRYLLPLVGTPWHRGAIFDNATDAPPTKPILGGRLRTN